MKVVLDSLTLNADGDDVAYLKLLDNYGNVLAEKAVNFATVEELQSKIQNRFQKIKAKQDALETKKQEINTMLQTINTQLQGGS